MSKLIPNSFQVPNSIVDDFIEKLSGNELKLYLIIIRKTKGWNKEFDGISISQFQEMSGISSHNTIRNSLKSLEEMGFIQEEKRDGKYSIFSLSDPYQKMTMSNIDPLPKIDTPPLPKIDTPPLPKIDNTKIHYPKEEEKEEENFSKFKILIDKFIDWRISIDNTKIIKKDSYKKRLLKNFKNNHSETLENWEEFKKTIFYLEHFYLGKYFENKLIKKIEIIENKYYLHMFDINDKHQILEVLNVDSLKNIAYKLKNKFEEKAA
jgi:hypothetical protein